MSSKSNTRTETQDTLGSVYQHEWQCTAISSERQGSSFTVYYRFVQGCCLQAVCCRYFWICFFCVFFLCFRFVSNYEIADGGEICAGGPCYDFWDHDVVDTMSIVNSIERTHLSGVVYRDIRPMKDHNEFGVGKVSVTDARVSVFF